MNRHHDAVGISAQKPLISACLYLKVSIVIKKGFFKKKEEDDATSICVIQNYFVAEASE